MLEPYYADGLVTIYHGDCREILPLLTLPDDTLTVTDPPYGDTSLTWDRWVEGWAGLLPGRQAWVFGSLRMWLDKARDEFGAWKLAQDIVWEKHNGSGSTNDRFRRVHEHALHFYRGEWGDLHHEMPRMREIRKRTERRKATPPHWGEFREGTFQSEDDAPRLLRSVMYCRSENGRAAHPTQKPLGVLRPLIEYSTAAGGTIIDPFMGSGSTLVACQQLGRKCIGFDVDEKWCRVARDRLAQAPLFVG